MEPEATVSVLQGWVRALPLREQGALVVGTRGCDTAPKYPLDSPERQLTAFLRYCVLVPADTREIDVPGAFFQSKPPLKWSQSMLGHYPMHWVAHLMHAFEIVAYRHPDFHRGGVINNLAFHSNVIYQRLVHGLHLEPESRDTMIRRLSEDRISAGTVVS